jgi:heterodisulfide reductase subunit C
VMALKRLSNHEKKHMAVAEQCTQCGKCSSGCPAARNLALRPRKIALTAQRDQLDELIGSEVIWNCTQCHQCMERCPREITPYDLIIYLQNLTVYLGYPYPKELDVILNSVKRYGAIQLPQEILDNEFDAYDRQSLNLPLLKGPKNIDQFNEAIETIMKEAHP